MINSSSIGKQFTDALTGATVTVVAVDTWKGGIAVCVTDPTMPNPAGIPGIGNYWVDSRNLTPLTSAS